MIHPLRGGATALLAVVAGGVGLAVFGATAASALTSSGNVTIVDASNKAIVTAPSRTVNDVTSNGTTTITSPTADFQSDDVGSTVTSTNLGLAGTVHIASVTNATTAVLDATPANTLTGTGNLTINTPLLPAGDFIASVTNGTTAVLNAASAHAGTTAGVNFVFASIPGAVCTTSGQNAQATRQKFGFDTPVLSCGSTSLTGAT